MRCSQFFGRRNWCGVRSQIKTRTSRLFPSFEVAGHPTRMMCGQRERQGRVAFTMAFRMFRAESGICTGHDWPF